MKRKLTYKQSVAELKNEGYTKMSEKTYQRAKTELEAGQHLKDLATDGFDEYSLDTIETTRAIDDELWSIVRASNDFWVKLKAIKMIMENCPQKSENFESGKALSYVSNEIKAAKAKNAKPVDKGELGNKTESVKVESGNKVDDDGMMQEGENVEKDMESGSN